MRYLDRALYGVLCVLNGMWLTALVLSIVAWRLEGVWAMLSFLGMNLHIMRKPRFKEAAEFFSK